MTLFSRCCTVLMSLVLLDLDTCLELWLIVEKLKKKKIVWFSADIMSTITDSNLVPAMNTILDISSPDAEFLTDNQIMEIIHHLSNSPTGIPWLDGLVPINYFTSTLTNRLQRPQHRGQLCITIVNTTPLSGPILPHAVGDHWICVAYQFS